jgi:hypothetical protein
LVPETLHQTNELPLKRETLGQLEPYQEVLLLFCLAAVAGTGMGLALAALQQQDFSGVLGVSAAGTEKPVVPTIAPTGTPVATKTLAPTLTLTSTRTPEIKSTPPATQTRAPEIKATKVVPPTITRTPTPTRVEVKSGGAETVMVTIPDKGIKFTAEQIKQGTQITLQPGETRLVIVGRQGERGKGEIRVESFTGVPGNLDFRLWGPDKRNAAWVGVNGQGDLPPTDARLVYNFKKEHFDPLAPNISDGLFGFARNMGPTPVRVKFGVENFAPYCAGKDFYAHSDSVDARGESVWEFTCNEDWRANSPGPNQLPPGIK